MNELVRIGDLEHAYFGERSILVAFLKVGKQELIFRIAFARPLLLSKRAIVQGRLSCLPSIAS